MTHFRFNAFRLLVAGSVVAASLLTGCQQTGEPAPVKPASCKIIKRYQENNPRIYWLYQYDAQGRAISYEQYEDGQKVSSTTYEYNSQGRIVKRIEVLTPPAGTGSSPQTTTCTYEYNAKNLATSSACVSSIDTYSTKGTFEYDAAGNLHRSTYVQTQGGKDHTQVILYEYKDGDCVKATNTFDSFGETIFLMEYYPGQENKNREDATLYLSGGAPSKHMLKKSAVTSNDGLSFTSAFTYEYNERGYPVKEQNTYSTASNTSITTFVNEYNCQ